MKFGQRSLLSCLYIVSIAASDCREIEVLYKLILMLILHLSAMQIFAQEADDQINESSSVFDLADEPGDGADDSIFSAINTGQIKPIKNEAHGYYTTAHVVVINKITAKSRQLSISTGKSAYFDNVELKLYKCWKSSDPYIKNNQILISIHENKFDEDQKLIFQGWLISSEPALSTFEHPVYEVLASDCVGDKVK